MRYRACYWILSTVLLWTPQVPVAKPTSDEFTVPLQAATAKSRSTPRGPGQVRTVKDDLTGKPALQARTAQAAIAAAVGQRAAGCRMIRFGADFGWVATGAAQYPASDNPVALRRSRQEARFKAFTDANARLAGCLSGLSPEARQRVSEALEQDDAIRLALINLAFTDADKREQALRILARGFVAYSAEDDTAQRTVYVNLVTTPKSATRLTRPAPNAVEAASLQEGLRQVRAEIGAGLIPPVGNRMIVVNATGELALVGYAANLIGAHPDPVAQDKLRTDAEKIATSRASEALMGLASGDDTAWQTGLDEATRNDIQATSNGYDGSEPSVRRFAQIRDLVMTTIKDDAGLQALREGRLPSAATIKRFDGGNAIAVALTYTPAIKKREVKPAPSPTAPVKKPVSSSSITPATPATGASTPPSQPATTTTSDVPPPPPATTITNDAAPSPSAAPKTDSLDNTGAGGGTAPAEPR